MKKRGIASATVDAVTKKDWYKLDLSAIGLEQVGADLLKPE